MKKKKISLSMPKGYNKPIHLMILILNLFGVLMVVSANVSTLNNASTFSLLFTGAKELGFFVLGYILMTQLARRFTLRKFFAKYKLYLFGILGLLLLTRLPVIGGSINGAYAWIHLGPFTLQPSEFAKIFVILMLACFLGDRQNKKLQNVRDLWMKPFIVVLIIVFIVTLYQRDLGSAVVILGISYICFLIPQHEKTAKWQKILLITLGVGLFMLIFISGETGLSIVEKLLGFVGADGYMLSRFHTASNPFLDRYNTSFQIYHGFAAFTNGGLLGTGYGNGFIKLSYLPEAESDFILAVIVEEFGMVGFALVFVGYAVILWQLFKYALKVTTEKEKIVLFGAIAYITIHYIFNVGGITALIPLTGVPLLFLSAGGSSKLAIMMLIGICQSIIARHNMKMSKKVSHENR